MAKRPDVVLGFTREAAEWLRDVAYCVGGRGRAKFNWQLFDALEASGIHTPDSHYVHDVKLCEDGVIFKWED